MKLEHVFRCGTSARRTLRALEDALREGAHRRGIRSQAVLIAIGINPEGRRQVLAFYRLPRRQHKHMKSTNLLAP